MGYNPPSLTSADVLAAITNDSTKFNGADIDAAISSITPGAAQLIFRGLPSVQQRGITTTPTNIAIDSITLPNLSYTIDAAYGGLWIGSIGSAPAADNRLVDGELQIQKNVGGSYTDAIADLELCGIVARDDYPEGMGWMTWGTIDVKAQVAFNSQMDFRILAATSAANNLVLWGLTPVLVLVVH